MLDSSVPEDQGEGPSRRSIMSLAENVAHSESVRPNGGGPHAELMNILTKMRAAQRKSGPADYDARVENLDKLERVILQRKHDIVKAIGMDYGSRSKHETLAAEVMVVVNEIKHART